MVYWSKDSLVPQVTPRFISQNIWEKAWAHWYVTGWKWWTQFVLTESTISGP